MIQSRFAVPGWVLLFLRCWVYPWGLATEFSRALRRVSDDLPRMRVLHAAHRESLIAMMLVVCAIRFGNPHRRLLGLRKYAGAEFFWLASRIFPGLGASVAGRRAHRFAFIVEIPTPAGTCRRISDFAQAIVRPIPAPDEEGEGEARRPETLDRRIAAQIRRRWSGHRRRSRPRKKTLQ